MSAWVSDERAASKPLSRNAGEGYLFLHFAFAGIGVGMIREHRKLAEPGEAAAS